MSVSEQREPSPWTLWLHREHGPQPRSRPHAQSGLGQATANRVLQVLGVKGSGGVPGEGRCLQRPRGCRESWRRKQAVPGREAPVVGRTGGPGDPKGHPGDCNRGPESRGGTQSPRGGQGHRAGPQSPRSTSRNVGSDLRVVGCLDGFKPWGALVPIAFGKRMPSAQWGGQKRQRWGPRHWLKGCGRHPGHRRQGFNPRAPET